MTLHTRKFFTALVLGATIAGQAEAGWWLVRRAWSIAGSQVRGG